MAETNPLFVVYCRFDDIPTPANEGIIDHVGMENRKNRLSGDVLDERGSMASEWHAREHHAWEYLVFMRLHRRINNPDKFAHLLIDSTMYQIAYGILSKEVDLCDIR